MKSNIINISIGVFLAVLEVLFIEALLNDHQHLGIKLASFSLIAGFAARAIVFLYYWEKRKDEYHTAPYDTHAVLSLFYPYLVFLLQPLKGMARYYADFGFVILTYLSVAGFVAFALFGL